MFELILHPFALGLYVGVFFCFYIFFSEMARRRHLKVKIKELEGTNESLKNSLHTQMSITEKGNRSREEEFDDLKRQNDMLLAKLTVKSCQYRIAIEGLNKIVESNDPVGIADKTLEAMNECMPKAEDLE